MLRKLWPQAQVMESRHQSRASTLNRFTSQDLPPTTHPTSTIFTSPSHQTTTSKMFARTDVTLHLLHHEHTGNKAGQFMLLGCAERLTTRREKDVVASMLCECVYYKRLRIFGRTRCGGPTWPTTRRSRSTFRRRPSRRTRCGRCSSSFGATTMADFVTDFRILGGNYHASDLALDNLKRPRTRSARPSPRWGSSPTSTCASRGTRWAAPTRCQLRKLPPCTACDLILHNPAVTKPLVRLFATHVKSWRFVGTRTGPKATSSATNTVCSPSSRRCASAR